MHRCPRMLTAALVVVSFSSLVFAQGSTAPQTAERKASTKRSVTVKKPAPLAVTGTVAKYDEATRTLTVTTKSGERSFVLGADTKIMASAKTAPTSDLVAGKNVKVTYTDAAGTLTATKVNVQAEKGAAKASKAAKVRRAEKK
jgi:hypothetical protein